MSNSVLGELFSALDLPVNSYVDRRVPKKLLIQNGAPTSSDKKLINERLEELFWLATLKPTTIGVPEYRDNVREYMEIAVLRLTLKSDNKVSRLEELVHRAVPYPVLLLTRSNCFAGLSAVHKRWAQNELGKTVLEGELNAAEFEAGCKTTLYKTFREALALGMQPRDTMHSLYQGWIETLHAYKAARLTGTFKLPVDAEQAGTRQEALRECMRLDAEIARLRSAASKEKQVARQVELNIEIKRIEMARANAIARM